MKTWEVKVNSMGMGIVVVEAETLEDAENTVLDMCDEDLMAEMDYHKGFEIVDTQEV